MPIPRPAASRLDPAREDYDAIIVAHEAAVRAGESSYRDPSTGLSVMTDTALAARGECCASGCRHCPYA
ncbi:MAG: DUF5522 domain-containing protein [Acidimicrobiales bacterium]